MADSPRPHDHHDRIDVLGSLTAQRDAAARGDLPHEDPEGAQGGVRPARAQDAAAMGHAQASTMAVSLSAGLEVDPGGLPQEIRGALDPQALAQGWSGAIEHAPSAEHRVLVAVEGERVVGFAAIAPAVVEHATAPEAPLDARDAAELEALPAQDPLPEGPEGTGARAAARGVLAEREAAADTLGVPRGEGGRSNESNESAGSPVPADPAQERRVEIVALEVPGEVGRRGHGSRLMAACVDLAREQGATIVQTWAVQGEESRARFLDSCGFAPMGLRREALLGSGRLVELCWEARV